MFFHFPTRKHKAITEGLSPDRIDIPNDPVIKEEYAYPFPAELPEPGCCSKKSQTPWSLRQSERISPSTSCKAVAADAMWMPLSSKCKALIFPSEWSVRNDIRCVIPKFRNKHIL